MKENYISCDDDILCLLSKTRYKYKKVTFEIVNLGAMIICVFSESLRNLIFETVCNIVEKITRDLLKR